MIFSLHSTFALELLSLIAGVDLLLFIKNQDKVKNIWPIFVSWFVIILSAIFLVCSVFHAIRLRYHGYYHMWGPIYNIEKHEHMRNYHKNYYHDRYRNEKYDKKD